MVHATSFVFFSSILRCTLTSEVRVRVGVRVGARVRFRFRLRVRVRVRVRAYRARVYRDGA